MMSAAGIAVVCGFLLTTGLRNVLRTLSIGRQDLSQVLFLDAAAVALLAVALGADAFRDAVDARSVFLILSLSNAAFILIWFIRYRNEIRPDITGVFGHLRASLAFGRWAFAVVGLSSAPFYLCPWLVMLFHGSEEVAVFAAASTIVGIANHAFLGVTKGIEARTADAYAARGMSGLGSVLGVTLRTAIPALAVIVLGLLIVAGSLAEFFLPDHASEVATVVRVLAMATLAGSVRVILGNGYWAMGRPEATLSSAIVRAVTSVALGVAGAYMAGALGCAIAVLAGDLLSSAVLARRFRNERRAHAI